MPQVAKAYAITDAKISFVSFVDKAANQRKLLIAKAENGSANFTTFGKILKADDAHNVTGIVYEPMPEDSQGNYMTEEEITKAAYWFAKNSNQVDLQHCFKKCEGASVVESYVAKCDEEIEGVPIKKGTWLVTMEITDDSVWDAIQKGEYTGFSMGGVGVYSEVDVDLDAIEKSEEPKGLLKKLAKALGFEVVEKGDVKDKYKKRVKSDNIYTAFRSLSDVLESYQYDPIRDTWIWDYTQDEETVRAALEDFSDIVTQLLTSESGVVKSIQSAAQNAPAEISKAGRKMSAKNKEALQGICDSLNAFITSFSDEGLDEGGENNVKKEDNIEMTNEEMNKVVNEAVAKAVEPITQKIEEIAKSVSASAPSEGEAGDQNEEIEKAVGEAVAKAMEPIMEKLEPLMKSRVLPGNLNDTKSVEKTEKPQHYMTGMF